MQRSTFMHLPARRSLLPFGCILGTALVAIAWYSGFLRKQQPVAPNESPYPILALSDSPYLNTKTNAQYVGSQTCRSCHPGPFASYAHTGMGRSMDDIHLDREPPDATVDHPLSGRRYQILRKDGQMWQRELLLANGEADVVLAEYPMRWVIGSGRHSRSYIAEIEGFLVESPVTWYSKKKTWAMSPGYDRKEHMGFGRPVNEGCLNCHAGQADAIEGSQHRIRISEAIIGCERCHGPGSLHVERWSNANRDARTHPEEVDYTIVNPTRLARGVSDAICEQCHLSSDARLTVRGHNVAEFRPGLPLQDVRLDYQLQIDDTPMKVVGHVDQLHRSRCYKASEELSCTTCHNPHGMPRPRDRVDYYRSICLNCHAERGCREPQSRRLAMSPENDCVHCHMPQSPTEITHLAFTHHRIGIHTASATSEHVESPASARQAGVLEPFHDLSRLSEIDKQRSLGIAYADAAGRQLEPALAAAYNLRAAELLWPLAGLDLRDARMEYVLHMLSLPMDRARATRYLEQALARPDLQIQLRCNGLHTLALIRKSENLLEKAYSAVQEVIKLRRDHRDWLLLAEIERLRGNQTKSIDALEAALRINTALPQVHASVAQYFEQQGHPQRAAWHRQRAVGP